MKIFVIIKLLFYFFNISAAINGTKTKRKLAGLILGRSQYSKDICAQLGCKDGMGYIGTNEDECYSVNRCLKCSKTGAKSKLHFCSAIPTLQNELTVFQGTLKPDESSIKTLKLTNSQSDDSDLSDDDNFKTGNSESSQEEEDDDEVDEEYASGDQSGYIDEQGNSAASLNISVSNGYSLLELVSQMTESEVEDVEVVNNKAKSNKQHSKGLLSRIFGKKKKTNADDTTQAAKFKKASKLSFNMNNFKNKFRNKSRTNKVDSGSEEANTVETTKETGISTVKISKGTTLEWKPSGRLLSDRLNKCIVS